MRDDYPRKKMLIDRGTWFSKVCGTSNLAPWGTASGPVADASLQWDGRMNIFRDREINGVCGENKKQMVNSPTWIPQKLQKKSRFWVKTFRTWDFENLRPTAFAQWKSLEFLFEKKWSSVGCLKISTRNGSWDQPLPEKVGAYSLEKDLNLGGSCGKPLMFGFLTFQNRCYDFGDHVQDTLKQCLCEKVRFQFSGFKRIQCIWVHGCSVAWNGLSPDFQA